MRLILDITPVTSRASRRTGLARVAMELARVLALRDDISLACSAWGSVYASYDVFRFLNASSEYGVYAGKLGFTERAYGKLLDRYIDSNRAIPTALTRLGQFLNVSRRPFPSGVLWNSDCVHSTFARIHTQVRRSQIPRVITIHDLTPLRLPPHLANSNEAAICRRMLGNLGPDDHVVCVSQATRDDVLDLTDLSSSQVDVVLNGVDTLSFRQLEAEMIERDLAPLGILNVPFVLSYSSLAPHKNLELILNIWPQIVSQCPEARLVLAGGKGDSLTGKLMALPPVVRDSIITLGRVSDQTITALCNACRAFVFPSYYEGFGLPILEAMACGARVICSNTSSMPEVAGGHAILVDPNDHAGWVTTIKRVLSSPADSTAQLAAVTHARTFTWEKAADQYVEVYRKLVSAHSRQ